MSESNWAYIIHWAAGFLVGMAMLRWLIDPVMDTIYERYGLKFLAIATTLLVAILISIVIVAYKMGL